MKVSEMLYYAVHPYKFRAMVHWKIFHVPLHERNVEKESATLQRCFYFLDLTSRSFSAVIQELTPELCVPVALFYLILRGLDTIEDDMTIPLEKKEPLLRTFDSILDTPGWNFKENGPNEKDRQLCCEFEVVIEEFAKIKPAYRDIIKDITHKMGNGMADYANNAEHNVNGVDSIEDYDLYCYYVAGLVGDGLTRLFVEAKLANPVLLDRPELSNSMGLFLQKTNIIRDIKEDFDDGRRFYPKEIWTKHVDRFDQLFDPKNKEAALNCISEMCLNALTHADECLFYLAGIKDQSVFHFTAIPQVMAIATLALVFRNPDILERNVKIPKGEACELMLEVGNLRSTSNIFRKYMKIIHKKNTPKDPNYLKISLALGKIEQWIEAVFPTPKDAALEELVAKANAPPPPPSIPTMQLVALVSVTLGILVFMSGVMLFCAHLAGARFDIAFASLLEGFKPIRDSIQKAAMDTGIIKPLASAAATASGVAHNEL